MMLNIFKTNNTEGKELNFENLFKRIGELKKENLELKNVNEMLREANTSMALANRILEGRLEGLEGEYEIAERLETDTDYYNTKELDRKSLNDALDKTTDERNTYKEVINVMCDKFNIEQEEVFNIIDDIQSNKDQQLEK